MGEINEERLRNYIVNPELSIHNPLPNIIPRVFDEMRLLHIPPGLQSTELVPKRNIFTGEIEAFVEIDLEYVGADAKNSTSMRREPNAIEEAIRGSAANCPFWPGGFDDTDDEINKLSSNDFQIDEDLLTLPPGFEYGYDFNNEHDNKFNQQEEQDFRNSLFYTDNNKSINLLKTLEVDLDVQEWYKLNESSKNSNNNDDNNDNTAITTVELTLQNGEQFQKLEDSMKDKNTETVLKISSTTTEHPMNRTEWAEMLDTKQNIDDFDKRIPCPAKKYNFALDTFQKQAILKLEERQYVFVAAHTSAGKTVVAEYAIALSQRDLTRTIYTSPIKALSNQKYRDFKKTFKDVGLITGDLQIDPTASCLIMTTEILRSMLYCGSDVTRDLEYVIFDEVHYINDPERGHVWEEVIILLPDHVNIIMLSATVPNTMELANWVGSTKKRKVFVISTLKRPVPLLHYLYTGAGGKSKDDITLLVNASGVFLQENYELAVAKKKAIQSKNKQNVATGPKKPQMTTTVKQDQNIWVGLVDFLKRNDKLPVVAFTLSRNRCDINAQLLQSVDLNTAREKGSVEMFFNQCLAKLKPPDRILPQVLTVKDSLSRGIGIHHRGILPILKEIVEMLFQAGLVKLLFATETFAMGVNMPARTVIFDSNHKYDGNQIRNLKPAEYIQMAGRAGRRGHDENGTVILLCKASVPSAADLRAMILGKPEKLQSQFILRYAVILTCLRIESIKVEDIMQFSFKEFNQKLQMPAQLKQLELAQNEFSQLPELDENLKGLCKFHDLGVEYIKEKQRLMKSLLNPPNVLSVKELKVGRVVMINYGRHCNKLAVLLLIKHVPTKETLYRVLVLDHQTKIDTPFDDDAKRSDMFYKLLALTPQHKFFHPDGINGHTILDVTAINFLGITKCSIKIEADAIIQNWEKRQMERFKDIVPNAAINKVLTELTQLNAKYNADPDSISYFNVTKEITLNLGNTELLQVQYLDYLEKQLKEIIPCTNYGDFENAFKIIYERKLLERHIEELKFKNSHQNLSLYPDYCNKLAVLKALKYIDERDEVTLKGKVACEMGQNELLITELILGNIFKDLEPSEIAALLSALVFRAKTDCEIPDKFKQHVEEFQKISDNILAEELKHRTVAESEGRLNFGLLEVVYEWARNKPFAEIMKLTDIQEGIIVRCIQQLDETIRDVKTAAMRIGNPALQHKMEQASDAIKRDIVFTASLYTTF